MQTVSLMEKVMVQEKTFPFEKYLVVYERVNGLKQILIRDLENESDYYIEFPEPVYTVYGSS